MPDAPITPGSPSRSANEDTPMDDAPPINAPMDPAGEVPYNKEFEDSVMRVILDPPAINDGVESRGPLPAFLLGRDTVPHEELPLPLDDPRRKYKSAIPGIKLTHPTGAYEGGNPATTDEDRAWTRDFIKRHNIKTAGDLERVKAQLIREQLDEMRRAAQARKQALDEREKIEKELKALNDQREIELKAQRNLIEKAKAKKEERRAKKTKLAAAVDEARRDVSPPMKRDDAMEVDTGSVLRSSPPKGPALSATSSTPVDPRPPTDPRVPTGPRRPTGPSSFRKPPIFTSFLPKRTPSARPLSSAGSPSSMGHPPPFELAFPARPSTPTGPSTLKLPQFSAKSPLPKTPMLARSLSSTGSSAYAGPSSPVTTALPDRASLPAKLHVLMKSSLPSKSSESSPSEGVHAQGWGPSSPSLLSSRVDKAGTTASQDSSVHEDKKWVDKAKTVATPSAGPRKDFATSQTNPSRRDGTPPPVRLFEPSQGSLEERQKRRQKITASRLGEEDESEDEVRKSLFTVKKKKRSALPNDFYSKDRRRKN